jgi:hypothetical protein
VKILFFIFLLILSNPANRGQRLLLNKHFYASENEKVAG